MATAQTRRDRKRRCAFESNRTTVPFAVQSIRRPVRESMNRRMTGIRYEIDLFCEQPWQPAGICHMRAFPRSLGNNTGGPGASHPEWISAECLVERRNDGEGACKLRNCAVASIPEERAVVLSRSVDRANSAQNIDGNFAADHFACASGRFPARQHRDPRCRRCCARPRAAASPSLSAPPLWL